MIPKKICVLGCGTLGSHISYLTVLRSLDDMITELFIIDKDILESKNIPYLSICEINSKFINKPKVFTLKYLLGDINKKLCIRTRYGKEDVCLDEYYVIDCRDTSESFKTTAIKVNIDGQFGSIDTDTQDKLENKQSRYSIKNSRFYSNFLASICVSVVFGDMQLEKGKFLVDLKKGILTPLFK